MADWIDHLTKSEAQAILALDEPRVRYPARNDRGERETRYTAPTASEIARIRLKAA